MSKDIDLKKLNDDMIQIFTLYQTAITRHGVKDIAYELKKSPKTVYAEISLENLQVYLDTIKNYDERVGKPSYLPKLGVLDCIIGMQISGDLSPLVAMASFFNMGCFKLPSGRFNRKNATRALTTIAQVANKECTESLNSIVDALSGDGIMDEKEARKTSRECEEAINALCEMKAAADWIAAENW